MRAAKELRRVARDTALEAKLVVNFPTDRMHLRAQEHDELVAVAEWLEEMAEETK